MLRKLPWKLVVNPDGSVRRWTVPAVLLAVVLFAYAPNLKHLGFYWDDWGFAWVRTYEGLAGLKIASVVTRPLRAYVEAALTPLLGLHPLAWQVYALLLRWLAALALWWFLRQLWTKSARPAFAAALLFAVFPDFSQQTIAMTYHYFWIFQAVLYLSLGLMVQAVRGPRPRWGLLALAVALAALQLFSSEYLVGVELVRPLIIWLALAPATPERKKRLGRTAVYTAPFLVAFVIYLAWRVFAVRFPTYQPILLAELKSAPLAALKDVLLSYLNSLGVLTAGAWGNTLQVNLHQLGVSSSLFTPVYTLLVGGGLAALILYQNRLRPEKESGTAAQAWRRPVALQWILVGLATVFFAGLPFYITGLNVTNHFETDRYSMAYLMGICLLLVGLLELLPDARQSLAVVSVMAALAIGLQFATSTLFRFETGLQQEFAWQLTWRMPQLKPGTLLLSDDDTFPYTDDEGLTYLVEWTYFPQPQAPHLSVALDTLSSRLGTAVLPSLDQGRSIYQDYYLGADFRGSTDQMLVLYYRPPSCLRVLNPAYDRGLVFLPIYKIQAGQITRLQAYSLPPLVAQALPHANLDQIIPDPGQPATPPAFLADPQPGTSWCYYFEKADLARQLGDWQQVAQLGDEAFKGQYGPSDLSEYLVFIEGYARTGNWQEAADLTGKVAAPAPVLDPMLCALWDRAAGAGTLTPADQAQVTRVKQGLQCSPAP